MNFCSKSKALLLISLLNAYFCGVLQYHKVEPIAPINDANDYSNPELFKLGLLVYPLKESVKEELINKFSFLSSFYKNFDYISENVGEYGVIYCDYFKNKKIRVYPINLLGSESEIRENMSRVNGAIVKGGSPRYLYRKNSENAYNHIRISVNPEDEFTLKIKLVLDIANEFNKSNKKFVLIGVCLGFQSIVMHESNYTAEMAVIDNFDSNQKVFVLKNDSNFYKYFLSNLDSIKESFQKGTAYFNHKHTIKLSTFLENEYLLKNFDPLIVFRKGNSNTLYVATYEHKTMPYFSTQFHPEKTLLMQNKLFHVNKDSHATKIAKFIQKYEHDLISRNHVSKNLPINYQGQFQTLYKMVGHYDDTYLVGDLATVEAISSPMNDK